MSMLHSAVKFRQNTPFTVNEFAKQSSYEGTSCGSSHARKKSTVTRVSM